MWVIVVEYYYRIGIYAKCYRNLNKANLYYSPFVICTPLPSEGLGEAFGEASVGGFFYCKLNPTAYAFIFVTIESKPLLRVGERC